MAANIPISARSLEGLAGNLHLLPLTPTRTVFQCGSASALSLLGVEEPRQVSTNGNPSMLWVLSMSARSKTSSVITPVTAVT